VRSATGLGVHVIPVIAGGGRSLQEEFDALVAEILPGLRILASGAPDVIRTDLSLIVESLERYLGGDDTAIVGDDYFDAFTRFEEFVLDVCDYELVG
jgi:hypothetical protein